MAHELEILDDGQASMAYVGESPWHGLGVEVEPGLTAKQMLVAAGLDWKVQKTPNYTRFITKYVDGSEVEHEDGTEYIPTGEYSILRETDGRILSPHVGANWEPVDNEKAFEFFTDFLKAGQMEMHTAGSLKGGEVVWGLAKIKDKFELFGGDLIEGYLFLSISHRHGLASVTDFTPIRVVCMNTLMMALNTKSKYSVSTNHRTAFDPEVVKLMMGIAGDQLHGYKEKAEFLGSKSYSGGAIKDYVRQLFPIGGAQKGSNELSRNAGRVLELIETQPGADFAPGTWWSVYNAATYFVDHEMTKTADSRLFNAWLGTGRKTKMEAFTDALVQAENA